MCDDNLDSFLDMIDADPDWSSDDDANPILSRIEKEGRPSTTTTTTQKSITSDSSKKNGLKFEDVFGSPIKKKSFANNSSNNKKQEISLTDFASSISTNRATTSTTASTTDPAKNRPSMKNKKPPPPAPHTNKNNSNHGLKLGNLFDIPASKKNPNQKDCKKKEISLLSAVKTSAISKKNTRPAAQPPSAPPAPPTVLPPKNNIKNYARMELQGGSSSMQRNSIRQGNHPSISFEQDKKHKLLPMTLKKQPAKELLKIDPRKTRHLTDKDRQILEALGASNTESDLPEMLALNPNAGARNYLQYLAKKQYELDVVRQKTKAGGGEEIKGYGQPVVMNKQTLKSMKEALQFVRKNGPISKTDPNKITGPIIIEDNTRKRRKLSDNTPSSSSSSSISGTASSTKMRSFLSSSSIDKGGGVGLSLRKNSKFNKNKRNNNIEVEFDFESDAFKNILQAKSKHETLLEEIQTEEYYSTMEKKEYHENKLLSTFAVPTSAVMCRECKYIAVSQSDFCREHRHIIRIVKATKRFFKCKDCGTRVMSLDRLPKNPCSNCKATSWLTAPVGIEKKGPLLPSEILSIRGDEEKFAGATGGKMFLHLSVDSTDS